MKIDHIAIVVKNVRVSAIKYKNVLHISEVHFEKIISEGVSIAILQLDNGKIELMEPLSNISPIRKFLDKNGGGLHHIALETSDIHNDMKHMKEKCGMQFLGKIRTGSNNTSITFIHPKSLDGVLLELCSH